MALPLPNLDDRRWQDLVDEGLALLPIHAPEWTDHNVHDPGVTMLELFAWIAETDIYRANRIPTERLRQFLALVGFVPTPPQPARTAISFQPANTAAFLPARTLVEGDDPTGRTIRFRTLERITASPIELTSIQVGEDGAIYDRTDTRRHGTPFLPFGDDPTSGHALYLGFSTPLPRVDRFAMFIEVPGDDRVTRAILQEKSERRRRGCRAPDALLRCDEPDESDEYRDVRPGHRDRVAPPLAHHDVRLVWEQPTAAGEWVALDVEDETRAFTLSGAVRLRAKHPAVATSIGQLETPLYYVRCRMAEGAYDAAPRVSTVHVNAVAAVQEDDVAETNWTIEPGVVPEGSAPSPGDEVAFSATFRSTNGGAPRIAALQFRASAGGFGGTASPAFEVLAYRAPTATDIGTFAITAALLGEGDGKPGQEVTLPVAPVAHGRLALFTLEATGVKDVWREWTIRPDFVTSGRRDAHARLDAMRGTVVFGDGEHGLALPAGARLFAQYRSTAGAAGNVAAGVISRLADTNANRVRIASFDALKASGRLAITNASAAHGGEDSERLSDAFARAVEAAGTTERAVTLADYERIARETPGTNVARAKAWANLHPAFPCFKAPGVVTVVVLPSLPKARPIPSDALRAAIRTELRARRTLGTRVEVRAPTYVSVSVRAAVWACANISPTGLADRVRSALDAFFHPLTGGPDGTGWPFGRDVYRSEVMQTIDETTGTDHVISLALVTVEGTTCGNVCVPPTGLVAAGVHEVEVMKGTS